MKEKIFLDSSHLIKKNEQGEFIWIVDTENPDWYLQIKDIEERRKSAGTETEKAILEILIQSDPRTCAKAFNREITPVERDILYLSGEYAMAELKEVAAHILARLKDLGMVKG